MPNPFVGPDPLKKGMPIHGRNDERQDLYDLLIAERIAWLYSPSGAGKSSLVRAGLVPMLENKGFDVWPVIRVHENSPGRGASANRYLESAMSYLGKPPEQAETFASYVAKRRKKETSRVVLIFDQFEELLTLYPTDEDKKEEFFHAVGTMLQDRRIWALFSLREDYLAGMDSYLRFIPTGRTNTFRLTPLARPAAKEVIENTAGDVFEEGAVERLVDNLAGVDGSHVEPVQLQVVCQRLWNQAHETGGTRTIDVDDVGDDVVDTALSKFYDDAVKDTAKNLPSSQRDIRTWFQDTLITERGFRNSVLDEPGVGAGLHAESIKHLEDSHHVIRSEKRGGQTWYELAHDRLIKPVKASNDEWFRTNLSAFQQQAALWDERGQRRDMLLRGEELQLAIEEERTHGEEFKQHEQLFLDTSRQARETALKERASSRRIQRLTLFVALAVLTAGVLLFAFAISMQRTARAREAKAAAELATKQAEAAAAASKAAEDQAKANAAASKAGEDQAKANAAASKAAEDQAKANAAASKAAEAQAKADAAAAKAAAELAKAVAAEEAARAKAAEIGKGLAIQKVYQIREDLVGALDDQYQSDDPSTALYGLGSLMPYENETFDVPDSGDTADLPKTLEPRVEKLIRDSFMPKLTPSDEGLSDLGWFALPGEDGALPETQRRNYAALGLALYQLEHEQKDGLRSDWPRLRSYFDESFARVHNLERRPSPTRLRIQGQSSSNSGDGGTSTQAAIPDFDIQEYEVTNAEYRLFVENHDMGKAGNLPAVNVTWYESMAYAAWMGGSLPSIQQWVDAEKQMEKHEMRNRGREPYTVSEWCSEAEGDVPGKPSSISVSDSLKRRELCGGSFSTDRKFLLPDSWQENVGFRVVWPAR